MSLVFFQACCLNRKDAACAVDPAWVHSPSAIFLFCFFPETVFFNLYGAQESIPPAYVAWQAGTTTLFLLGSQPPWIVLIGGQANFFLKSANSKSANSWAHSTIANPQISQGVSPKLRILKYFGQIRKFLQNTAKLCLKTVLKIIFFNGFLCINFVRVLYAINVRRNNIFGLAEV